MATTIDNIGDGNGYLYCADLAGVLISADKNNADGIRNMRNLGIGASPIAANKSAVGSVAIVSCDAGYYIQTLLVNGVDILNGSPFVCSSTDTTAEAQALAVLINAQNSGYRSYNITNICYIQAQQELGASCNGQVVDASDSGGIVVVTANLSGGADSTNVTDDISGRRFYLDAAGSSNEIGVDAIEITKYIIIRGLNSGLISKQKSILNDAISAIDRSSAIETIYLNPESGSSDSVVFIDPTEYIDGDIVILKCFDDNDTITIEDLTTSSSPFIKNILLMQQSPCVLTTRLPLIMLQYQFDPSFGGIFTEINRSLSPANIFTGHVLWVDKVYGDDATAKPYNFTYKYQTITEAANAAVSGDLIYVLPGNYSENIALLDGIDYYLSEGTTVETVGTYTTIGSTSFRTSTLDTAIVSNVYGLGIIKAASINALAGTAIAITGGNVKSSIECLEVTGYYNGIYFENASNADSNIKVTCKNLNTYFQYPYVVRGYSVNNTATGNTNLVVNADIITSSGAGVMMNNYKGNSFINYNLFIGLTNSQAAALNGGYSPNALFNVGGLFHATTWPYQTGTITIKGDAVMAWDGAAIGRPNHEGYVLRNLSGNVKYKGDINITGTMAGIASENSYTGFLQFEGTLTVAANIPVETTASGIRTVLKRSTVRRLSSSPDNNVILSIGQDSLIELNNVNLIKLSAGGNTDAMIQITGSTTRPIFKNTDIIAQGSSSFLAVDAIAPVSGYFRNCVSNIAKGSNVTVVGSLVESEPRLISYDYQ